MRPLFVFFFFIGSFCATIEAQPLLSPQEFFTNFGSSFPLHHRLVAYTDHLANASLNAQKISYGSTYEGRPLQVLAFGTPERLAVIPELFARNRARAGRSAGSVPDLKNDDPAIIWLSYGVHGNEAAAQQAAQEIAYRLAAAKDSTAQFYLENLVVILDPCLNPDGYDQYAQWFGRVASPLEQPDLDSWQHDEPWPGGRTNHYGFDLNRDWLWCVQQESAARNSLYQQVLPQIHIDVHEQNIYSPYYFGPAADPIHPLIQPWQLEEQQSLADQLAARFDEEGWLYFTREVFDLFYPSYGDSYPSLNGAVGVTFEQAGSKQAGTSVHLETGDTLTLNQRIDHHVTTSWLTLSYAANNSQQIVRQFTNFFSALTSASANQSSFVIKEGAGKSHRARNLRRLLDRHAITYGVAANKLQRSAESYRTGKTERFSASETDLIITTDQPQGRLVQVLFEPAAVLSDSLTYDITAWALPFAYGFDAYQLTESVPLKPIELPTEQRRLATLSPYAILVPWGELNAARFLVALQDAGIHVRQAQMQFQLAGKSWEPGTLVINRSEQILVPTWQQTLIDLADLHDVQWVTAQTGHSEKGPDLGSDKFSLLLPKRVLLAGGAGTSPSSFGFARFFFERTLRKSIVIVELVDLEQKFLDVYDVIIIPETTEPCSEQLSQKLENWVNAGGNLQLIGKANVHLPELALTLDELKSTDLDVNEESYFDPHRHHISSSTPGGIVQLEMDPFHPLSYGLRGSYFSLKTNSLGFENGTTIGRIAASPRMFGFFGSQVKGWLPSKTMIASRTFGAGEVLCFADDPLFRGFWERGQLLFANGVF